MYVKHFELQNFQVIKEFTGEFEGNVYLVTGDNELGKSTFLKALTMLITGNRDEVLMNGEEKGFAKMIIGDDSISYDVELKFTKANPKGTLTITDQNTGLRTDKISTLQAIFGYQDFDAVEFCKWSETAEGRRKQVEIVKSLLPIEVQHQIQKIDQKVIEVKEARKGDNSEQKIYESAINTFLKEVPVGDINKYNSEISLTSLIEKKTQSAALAEQYKGVKARYDLRVSELQGIPVKGHEIENKFMQFAKKSQQDQEALKEEYERRLKDLENTYTEGFKQKNKDLDELELHEKELKENIEKAEKYFSETKLIPLDEIQKEIDLAENHNIKFRKVETYQKTKNQLDAVVLKIAGKGKELAKLASEREKLILSSKLPINGLNFSDEGLMLNGIEFAPGKVSSSQEMEVAAKLIMAKNPTVKVFRIARGESLGKKKFESIVQFAKDNGYQGFIEQVVREQNELRVEEYTEK